MNENDILARLHLFYTEPEAQRWLDTPHPLLHYQSARELIKAGRIAEVDRLVAALEDGTFS